MSRGNRQKSHPELRVVKTVKYFPIVNTLHYSVIIGNVYGVCCPVNISTEHINFHAS